MKKHPKYSAAYRRKYCVECLYRAHLPLGGACEGCRKGDGFKKRRKRRNETIHRLGAGRAGQTV